MLPMSPTAGRIAVYDYLMDEWRVYTGTIEEELDAESLAEKIKHIEAHYEEKLINPDFILNSYSNQYDSDFWCKILKLPEKTRANYRFLKYLWWKEQWRLKIMKQISYVE